VGEYQQQGITNGEPATLIAPLGGRLLVFESRMEHEVLPCNRVRYSVTAWMYGGGDTDGMHAVGSRGAVAYAPQQPQPPAAPAAAEPAPPAPAEPAEPAEPAGSTEVLSGRIFVSIAAYRDPECAWTLRDLFLKAAHPEHVFAGVVWQVGLLCSSVFVVAGLRATPSPLSLSLASMINTNHPNPYPPTPNPTKTTHLQPDRPLRS